MMYQEIALTIDSDSTIQDVQQLLDAARRSGADKYSQVLIRSLGDVTVLSVVQDRPTTRIKPTLRSEEPKRRVGFR